MLIESRDKIELIYSVSHLTKSTRAKETTDDPIRCTCALIPTACECKAHAVSATFN